MASNTPRGWDESATGATDVVFQLTDLAFPISLSQDGPDNFTVTYGREVSDHLTYAQAARELGESILHALACDGRVDNSVAE